MKRNQIGQCISQLLKTKPNNTFRFLNILSWKIIQLDFRFLKLNIQNNYSWDEIKYENFYSESTYFKKLLVSGIGAAYNEWLIHYCCNKNN